MNKEHIKKIQDLLTGWNPLGDQAAQISDLNGYETEATDILFHAKKQYSIERISNLIITVLEQAFDLNISESDAKTYAEKVSKILRD